MSCLLNIVNLECRYLFKDSDFIYFGYVLQSGAPGSYTGSSLKFLRNLHTIFHGSCIKCVQGFPFLYILMNNKLFVVSFGDSHSDRCKVISHCGFDVYLSGG